MLTKRRNVHGLALFVVCVTITKDKEAAFNKWYNEEHVPQVLQYNGAVSGRRYKRIMGDDKYEYMAVYEFASEEVFRKFQQSDHLESPAHGVRQTLGEVSERMGTGWVQVFP